MAPPEESNGVSMGQQDVPAVYTTEPKRMRLSGAATVATAVAAAAGSSTTTRAATGAPSAMTNKGSVYKAQRGRGERTLSLTTEQHTIRRVANHPSNERAVSLRYDVDELSS